MCSMELLLFKYFSSISFLNFLYVNGLQSLVDQTFQQFALDDSEDESGKNLEGSSSDLLMENGVEPCLSPLSNLAHSK